MPRLVEYSTQSRTLRTVLARCFVMIVLLGYAGEASADGKFFRRLEVADEPGIAAQRAVVAFRDGVETLIVQSDIENAGESLGWVLPLPAEPTSIEACQSMTLKALTQIVTPEFAKPKTRLMIFFLALMGLTIYACLDHVHCKQHGIERGFLISLLALLFLIMISLFMVPSLMGVPAKVAGGDVEILQNTRAGVYDVSIIKAQDGAAVTDWLTSNGFACPPSARPIIEEYVTDNWCFLAAKVSPEKSGNVTHHPLRVSFPTSRAIYPLRLTGSDGSPIQLDLFVIAKKQAATAMMKTWVSERMKIENDYRRFAKYETSRPPIYRGRGFLSVRIGLPDVSDLMWPGCTFTRLRGKLSSRDMEEDLTLDWIAPKDSQIKLHDRNSALSLSAIAAAAAVIFMFPLFVPTATKQRWAWHTFARKRLPITLTTALIAGVICYSALDVEPLKAGTSMHPIFAASAHDKVLRKLANRPGNKPFVETYQQIVDEVEMNDYIQMTPTFEKPGDYMIEATSNGWNLTILDAFYIPSTIAISSNGMPASAEN